MIKYKRLVLISLIVVVLASIDIFCYYIAPFAWNQDSADIFIICMFGSVTFIIVLIAAFCTLVFYKPRR